MVLLGVHILVEILPQTKPDENAAAEGTLPVVNAAAITSTGSVTGSDDYYQTVVITSLLAVLRDQSMSNHHHTVIEAIMNIFKTQGLKCVTFLPQVLSLRK